MFAEYENSEKIDLISLDGRVIYYPNFLTDIQSQELMQRIMAEALLEQNEITLFGKKIKVPRLEAYFALNGEQYGYAGQTFTVHAFPAYLDELRQKVQKHTGCQFNALLINYYRDGQDSNGWHSDDEKALGTNPSIASLSLGAARPFEFKHKFNGNRKKLILANGSLLLMDGPLQHHYKHQLPKVKEPTNERINLTFRWVVQR